MATEGKWTCSTHEEQWDCTEEFDTKEDAIAYAISEHAPSYGIEDGCSIFIGRIHKIEVSELARQAISGARIVEDLEEALWEHCGEAADDGLDVPNGASDDLEKRVIAAIETWAAEHSIAPTCYTLEQIERHTWRQCDLLRAVPNAACGSCCDDVSVRCLLHEGHEGEHNFP